MDTAEELSEPFKLVMPQDYSILTDILKHRIPQSGGMYNIVRTLDNLEAEQSTKCFTLNGDLTSNALLLIIIETLDFGQNISTSIPDGFVADSKIKEALRSTKIINWKGSYMFVGIERSLSSTILDIGSFTFGNTVQLAPTNSYWVDPKIVASLEFKELLNQEDADGEEDGICVRNLDIDQGTSFMMKNWTYARSEAGLRKMISNNISAGVYHQGELVTAGMLSSHGMLGPLVTSLPHRRKGYGTKCAQFLVKEMLRRGLYLISSAAKENVRSIALHLKLMSLTHESDWIFHTAFDSSK